MEWKRGCNINDAPKKQFNKNDNNKKNDEKKNNYKKERNRVKDEKLEKIRIENEKKKEEAEKLIFNTINYPELSKPIVSNEKDESSKYLEKVKIANEEDYSQLFLRNKNNWRGNVWIGPKFMKKEKFSQIYNDYLKDALKNASTIVMPLTKTYYSRNEIDWYKSWEECFKKEEFDLMNEQLEREEREEMCKRAENAFNKIYERRKRESEQYYYETGNLDSFAIVEKQCEEYDNWEDEFNRQFEEEEEEIEEEEEEDYYSD